MKLFIKTNVFPSIKRGCKGQPEYAVEVCDLDSLCNYHSFESVFYKEGFDYEELMKQAKEFINQEQNG